MTAKKTINVAVRRPKRTPATNYAAADAAAPGTSLNTATNMVPSLLEQCGNTATENMDAINSIGNRIISLLDHLRGSEPRAGEASDDKFVSRGRLNDHLDELQWQQQRLADIQNDLTLLESLL